MTKEWTPFWATKIRLTFLSARAIPHPRRKAVGPVRSDVRRKECEVKHAYAITPITLPCSTLNQSHAHPSARARPCHRRALPTPPPFHGSTPASPAQKPPKEHGVPPLSSSQPCGGRSCNTLKFASFGNRSKMIKFGILCSLKHRK